MPLDKEIDAAASRVANLRDDLRRAERRLHDLRCQKIGVAVGDIVRDKTGKLFRVTNVQPWFPGAWLTGNPRRKDGKFGTATRSIGPEWEKVDEPRDPQ